jgi:hypothetical protein
MTDLEREIERQRLSDEYHELGFTNVAIQEGESYEDNLKKRAELTLRRNEILSKLYDF